MVSKCTCTDSVVVTMQCFVNKANPVGHPSATSSLGSFYCLVLQKFRFYCYFVCVLPCILYSAKDPHTQLGRGLRLKKSDQLGEEKNTATNF